MRHLSHRGGRRPRPPVASAWQCEGRWQAADQMDIWQCCDEVELDRQRASGDDSDDEDTPDTDEQHRD